MKYINLFVLLISVFASNVFAWSSIGEAEVQIRDGAVCFTVTEEEFERAGGVIYFFQYSLRRVSESGRESKDVWGLFLEKNLPFKRGECIRYGELLKGARIGSRFGVEFPEKAPELEPDVFYTLGIGALGPKTPTAGYVVKFCLKQDDAGALVVKKVRNSCDESGTEAP